MPDQRDPDTPGPIDEDELTATFAELVAPAAYPDPQLVGDAIMHALAAAKPRLVGDHGIAQVIPAGYELVINDVREFENRPRFREGHQSFIDVQSLARYVNRYRGVGTLAYINDLYGKGPKALVEPVTAVTVVLDDHPPTTEGAPGRRQHQASLVLKPTAAARRWGRVLDRWIDQEELLDLVVDGVSEIVQPDAADLRDLVSDLHAIRTAEVKQVQRTGGTGSITVAENVTLHAGQGNRVEFPEEITVSFAPYAGVEGDLAGVIRVKAQLRDGRVHFALTAPFLDDAIAHILLVIAAQVAAQTNLAPLWRP